MVPILESLIEIDAGLENNYSFLGFILAPGG